MTAPSRSFYQRSLPISCTNFASAAGKEIFKRALASGQAESYFELAQAFLTQDEPAFCALGTLCMVLNALHVDPLRKWKGGWRWFDQSMLDCCRPLEKIAKDGLTLPEFLCLAKCNGLRTQTIGGTAAFPEDDAKGLADFEQALIRSTSADNLIMAVTFSRKTLGQTGDGHFSCVAAYSPEDRKALILDVARFKYCSYWVDIDLLYQSFKPHDSATNKPRGYTLLSRPNVEDQQQSCLRLNLNKQSYSSLRRSLRTELAKATSLQETFEIFCATILATRNIPIERRTLSNQEDKPEDVQKAEDALNTNYSHLEEDLISWEHRSAVKVEDQRLYNLLFIAMLLANLLPFDAALRDEVNQYLAEFNEARKGLTTLHQEMDIIKGLLINLNCCCADEKCC